MQTTRSTKPISSTVIAQADAGRLLMPERMSAQESFLSVRSLMVLAQHARIQHTALRTNELHL